MGDGPLSLLLDDPQMINYPRYASRKGSSEITLLFLDLLRSSGN
jgi:hypothetical protein